MYIIYKYICSKGWTYSFENFLTKKKTECKKHGVKVKGHKIVEHVHLNSVKAKNTRKYR